MAISANSLYHFTSLKNLKSILGDGYFQIKYSLESFTFRGNNVKIYIPMVCFCDLPLTQTK